MRIYPTTIYHHHYLDEDQTIQTLSYQVVGFNEYLYDQNIDPFYIEKVTIITPTQEIELSKKTLEYAYLGYLDNPKDIALIFPRDKTCTQWLFEVQDIKLTHKTNIPMWGDEKDV